MRVPLGTPVKCLFPRTCGPPSCPAAVFSNLAHLGEAHPKGVEYRLILSRLLDSVSAPVRIACLRVVKWRSDVKPVGRSLVSLDDFSFFELEMRKRSRNWEWSIGSRDGKAIMRGRSRKRVVARYQARSALFLLLMSASVAARGRK